MFLKKLCLLLVFFVLAAPSGRALAHCEIPCGIYDDHARIHGMMEDVATIQKATVMMLALQKKGETGSNQLVRWIHAKDEHASKIQTTVAQYFLTQRIKESAQKTKYFSHLQELHKILVLAMKTKQKVSVKAVMALRQAIADFERSYLDEKGKTSVKK